MVATFSALSLGALALLAMTWNLRLAPFDSRLAGSLADDPFRVLSQTRAELTRNPSGPSLAYRSAVLGAARREPLSDEAFVVAAFGAANEGRYSEALRLLEIARQRDPRNAITRVMLLEAYLRQANAKQVVTEAGVLERLRPGSTQTLLPVLASLVQNDTTRAATKQALQGSLLNYPIMRELAEQQVDPALIMALSARMTAEQLSSDSIRQQVGGLIDPYLKAERWPEAAQLWAHFYARQPADLGRVIDPKFSGNVGPPFGWQISASDGGLAEQSVAGLQVVHFGRKNWVVARQALLLTPGTYRLNYSLGTQGTSLPDLAWRVDCATSGTTLIDLPFERANILGTRVTDRFTVPVDACPAQWLALAARVGDERGARSVVIRSVEILRLGNE
ncbi:hypothetical protein GVM20_00595 [Porphyrobacter sp. SLTP]|uniref:hypothetical protein n=1 Tax=Porphyrobacter sp. SLTP TaxID=2683266 RepID=UPI001411D29B|nr:hypothetical protein [Porphyrobacter sp. SLTP]NBB23621.1 hypothetical protein [Porphyrobacter sp. SLTP]